MRPHSPGRDARPRNKGETQMSRPIAAAALTAALLCSSGGRDASAGILDKTLTVEGNTIAVTSGPANGAVTFNGRRIIDSNNGVIAAHGTYPASGKTFILIEEDQGPSCAMFQIIAVAGKQASVSPLFGNCGDLPTATVVDGALRVQFRAMPAHGSVPVSPAQTHSFDGSTFR